MRTDEEIAKAATEAIGDYYWRDGHTADRVVGMVLAAIREAVRQVPGEPPVSAKDIDGIGGVNVTAGWNNTSAQWAIDKLLTQLAHYERLTALLLRDEAGVAYAEGLAEGRRLGWEAGALAQREADVAAVADDAEYVGDIRLASGKRFAERLSDLPLADPS